MNALQMAMKKNAGAFPPYELLDSDELLGGAMRLAQEKTRRLERLYHHTLEHGWNGREVLDGLIKKHGGIHIPHDKRGPVGRVFSIILWGELAAWNIAADLAACLPDVDAKMAASGQAFDEARHFTVLREYLVRSGVEVPPLHPLGRRVLVRLLETDSPIEKLSGMQLLVENLALAIFKRVAAAGIDPVLTDLLAYIERDESRHVGLGVMYLPKLLGHASAIDRARLFGFTLELTALSIGQGRRFDADFRALGIDHRELAIQTARLQDHMRRQMLEHAGMGPRARIRGLYTLSAKQHLKLIDFLHPETPADITPRHRAALAALDVAVRAAERVLS